MSLFIKNNSFSLSKQNKKKRVWVSADIKHSVAGFSLDSIIWRKTTLSPQLNMAAENCKLEILEIAIKELDALDTCLRSKATDDQAEKVKQIIADIKVQITKINELSNNISSSLIKPANGYWSFVKVAKNLAVRYRELMEKDIKGYYENILIAISIRLTCF